MIRECTVCDGPASSVAPLVGLDGQSYQEVKCPDCGLAWAEPLPASEAISEGMYDGEFYAGSMGSGQREAAERRVVTAMADFAESVVPRRAFLDVGCGDGLHMALMRERGWEVHGVEVSRYAVLHARRAHNLEVFQGTLSEARFHPETFAFVQFRHVVEHLSDPRSTIELAADLLQPGGVLRIDTPAGDFLRSGLGFAFRALDCALSARSRRFLDPARLHLAPPMHLFCFTETALRRLVECCGLKVLKIIRTYHGDPEHYPHPAPASPFARAARTLDIVSAKANLGELLILYARKTAGGRAP